MITAYTFHTLDDIVWGNTQTSSDQHQWRLLLIDRTLNLEGQQKEIEMDPLEHGELADVASFAFPSR